MGGKGLNFVLDTELSGHTAPISCVRFSGDNTMLASCSADKTVLIWLLVDKADKWAPQSKPIIKFEGHAAGVNDVAWDPLSQFVASASDDRSVRIWSIKTKECVQHLTEHTSYVFCCEFNPQGTILVTGSFDETIRLWNVGSGKCMRELPAHSDPVTATSYNRDGTMFVSSSHDGLCRIWDGLNGHCLKTLIESASPPVAFATFSPNGKYVLIGTLDNAIRLWSFVDTGKIMKTYRGHKNEMYCMHQTFLIHKEVEHCKYVVSGSEDNSIYIWNLNSKAIAQVIAGRKSESDEGPGHTKPILTVAADKERFKLASAGFDKVIKLWTHDGTLKA